MKLETETQAWVSNELTFWENSKQGGGQEAELGEAGASEPEVGDPGENSEEPFKRRGCGQMQGWL